MELKNLAVGDIVSCRVNDYNSKTYLFKVITINDKYIHATDRDGNRDTIPSHMVISREPDNDKFFSTRFYIEDECDSIKELLLKKNESYGDSAIEPVRIFSKCSPDEQILVRIDDKLSRIAKGKDFLTEDVLTDLIGYLILLKINRRVNKGNNK